MAPRLTFETISRIKELRQKGWSLPEIQREVSVGYGTIHRYIVGVNILPEYESLWKSKRLSSVARKKKAENDASEKAKTALKSLSNKEKMLLLSALYWAEGSKRDFGLSNSDPNLIKVFIKGLTEIFGINKDDMRVSIRIFEDMDKQKCLAFWSEITGVHVEKFVNVNVLEGKKKGKLPYGMCRVRVIKGGDMLKYITALKNRVIELFDLSP